MARFLFLIISLAYFPPVLAQQVAVMEARVEVISGAAIESLQNGVSILPDAVIEDEPLSFGNFLLKSAPSTQVHAHVEVMRSEDFENNFIEEIEVENSITENGEQLISVTGTVNKLASRAGTSQNVLMVVDYL